MPATTFGGVSPRSLGDLLKGYGLIAAVGEQIPETRFWWDEGLHLVASFPEEINPTITIQEALRRLPQWAKSVAAEFGRTVKKSCDQPLPCPDLADHLANEPRFKQRKNKKKCSFILADATDSRLKFGASHDIFDPWIAGFARAAAMPRAEIAQTAEPHPLFGVTGVRLNFSDGEQPAQNQ